MAWVNLDDNYPDHPKVDALSDGAFRLHTAAICWCNRHLTDGFVEVARVPRLVPRYKAAYLEELMHGGLWEPADGGYRLHDFLDWNRSREEVERRRQKRSEAGKKGMESRWGKRA